MDSNATLYESQAANRKGANSIKFLIKGTEKNPGAIGAKLKLTTDSGSQWHELYTVRGYLSSIDPAVVFGIKNNESASLIITWPDGEISKISSLEANKTYVIDYYETEKEKVLDLEKQSKIFSNIKSSGITFQHKEDDFNDYQKQVLLPHSQSNVGPSIVKGDINGDGLDDVFVGGAAGQSGILYIQNISGEFFEIKGPWNQDIQYEDTGGLFFDSDGDNDLDLYIVSGGAHLAENDLLYQDRLYINDGKGNFNKASKNIPIILISGQAVAASDIDGDGDQDLFIGGIITPDQYPYAPNSYLLINNNGKFTKQQIEVNQMVSSALFSDYDSDGDDDLITVGEWSPIKIFNNENGSLSPANIESLNETTGLWFSLAENDLDQDGDIDYFIGNIGLNTKFKVNDKKEFHIYSHDFYSNGTYDIVLSSNYNGNLVPSRGRECSSEQMPFIKDKFEDYRSFANATLNISILLKIKKCIVLPIRLEKQVV